MKMMAWYFEEGGVLLWRWWCGTLKTVVWYLENDVVVLWKGWCGTLRWCCGILKRVMWYFEDDDVVLWYGWCGTLKRVLWYFEEGGVVPWRAWCGTLKRICYVILLTRAGSCSVGPANPSYFCFQFSSRGYTTSYSAKSQSRSTSGRRTQHDFKRRLTIRLFENTYIFNRIPNFSFPPHICIGNKNLFNTYMHLQHIY